MKYIILVLAALSYAQTDYKINIIIKNTTNSHFEFQYQDGKDKHTAQCSKKSTCNLKWHKKTPFHITLENLKCGKHHCYHQGKRFQHRKVHSRINQHIHHLELKRHFGRKVHINFNEETISLRSLPQESH